MALFGVGLWMLLHDQVYDTKLMVKPDLMDNSIPWTGAMGGLLAVGTYNFIIGILGMAGSGCDLDKKVKNCLIVVSFTLILYFI